jgi:hypothetical protein
MLTIAVLLFTRCDYIGDTMWYAGDIVNFDKGPSAGSPNLLWEFGHLLWRPAGWVIYKLFGSLSPYGTTGEDILSATAILIAFSLVCGFICILLIQSLALRVLNGHWLANLVSLGFLCSYAFLNYAHTGSAYIPGMMLLLLAIWLIVRAVERPEPRLRLGLLAGAAAGLSTLFWFPYVLGIPAVLAVAYLWGERPNASSDSDRHRLVLYALCSIAVAIGAAYTLAIQQLHIYSLSQFRAWVAAASHGWSQSNRLIRMISGLPRSFLQLGDDGMAIKRYLLRDPFAHVSLMDLFRMHIWKVVVFYLFSLSLIAALWRMRAGRRMLALLALAALPVLAFALFVFESGSPERYLPIYPFLFLAAALCLSRVPRSRAAQGVVLSFLALTLLMNIHALSRNVPEAGLQNAANRVASLHDRVTGNGLVALVTYRDDAYRYAVSFPFEAVNRKLVLPVYAVVEPGTARVPTWKRDFAERALNTMVQGQSVWISKRLLAERPDPAWNWTEGDDRRISWIDLYPFFRSLSFSAETGGPDGFIKLDDSERNKDVLIASK